MPAAPGDQAGATRRLLPPRASLPRHCCTGGPSCGRASSKEGDAATELKVGTSRAAPWRDPVPASDTTGSARGRGPGAFCGCLGSRERSPGGEGCAHATAVWSSPGSSRGVPGTQSALSGGAPESILTLHAGFLGSPGRSSVAESSFTCRFTVCRHGMQHPHQWASLSHSLIMNTARVCGLPTWSVLGPRPWGQLNGRGPQHLVGKLGVSLASGYPCLSGPALLTVSGCERKRDKCVHSLSCTKIGWAPTVGSSLYQVLGVHSCFFF